MILETLTTITLLTELLLALRANDPKGFRTLLEMGLDELGLNVVDELTRDFLVPLLSEEEADRMVGWNWGVSLKPDGGCIPLKQVHLFPAVL